MNCDCIKDIEAKLADRMKLLAGDDVTAKVMNTAFFVSDDGLGYTLQIPFRVKGSKKGFTSEKGKEIGCNVSCCPFCGREARAGRYRVGQDDGLDKAFGFAKEAQA